MQKKPGWQTDSIQKSISAIAVVFGEPGTQAWTEYDADTGLVSIRFDEAGQGTGGNTASAPLVDGFTDWKKVNHVVMQDGKAILSHSWKDSVLKIGGDGSTKKITLEAGKREGGHPVGILYGNSVIGRKRLRDELKTIMVP